VKYYAEERPLLHNWHLRMLSSADDAAAKQKLLKKRRGIMLKKLNQLKIRDRLVYQGF